MPGSVYDILAKSMAGKIGKLPRATIDCDTETTSRYLRQLQQKEGEVLASLDKTPLFTMVPLKETVERNVRLLDGGVY